MRIHFGKLLVALFSAIVGGLMLWGFIATFDPKYHPQIFAVYWFNNIASIVTALLLIGTAVCLLIHRLSLTALTLHRYAFWGLTLIVASGFLELTLRPNEGGVGGFLMVIGLYIFALFACITFLCQWYLRYIEFG